MVGINLWAYSLGSTVLAAAVLTNAFQTKEQFYPAMVYLTKSKPCMMVPLAIVVSILTSHLQVFGNLGVMLTILLGHVLKKMFLGQLRDIEVEVRFFS